MRKILGLIDNQNRGFSFVMLLDKKPLQLCQALSGCHCRRLESKVVKYVDQEVMEAQFGVKDKRRFDATIMLL